MGESSSDKPDPSEPSIEDLLKSDDFQSKLEAARARRAQVQADRAKSGQPRKLRPIRPGGAAEAPPSPASEPMRLGSAERAERPSATVISLTPGMRISPERDGPSSESAAARDSSISPVAAPPQVAPRKLGGADSRLRDAEPRVPSKFRTILTSVVAVVIGFAAGTLVMVLVGREVSIPLPAMLGGESQQVGAIRATRDFELMTAVPAQPGEANGGGEVELAARAPLLEVPDAPPAADGAAVPNLAADPPDAPFAEQAETSQVAIFAAEDIPLDGLTERLATLGITEVETRSVGLASDGIAIRFYRDQDASLARGLASLLDASLQDLTSFRPLPDEPRIEIWVGEI